MDCIDRILRPADLGLTADQVRLLARADVARASAGVPVPDGLVTADELDRYAATASGAAALASQPGLAGVLAVLRRDRAGLELAKPRLSGIGRPRSSHIGYPRSTGGPVPTPPRCGR